MTDTLTRIKPFHAPLVPPQGAEMFGMTPQGDQLFRETRARSRSLPRLDEEGDAKMAELERLKGEGGLKSEVYESRKASIIDQHQQWQKHAINGQKLYPLRKPERYSETIIYFLESDGHGNVGKVMWAPPTEKERAEAVRRQRIQEMQGSLAAALVDGGLTPDDLVQALSARRNMPAPTDAPPDTLPDTAGSGGQEKPEDTGAGSTEGFPKAQPGGYYELSTGDRVKGKERAQEAQDRINQAKKDADIVAEE